MSDSKKWKSKFLSSSFPLEFDVAKILVSKGFGVQSDFTYSRYDNGIIKDFSVDILASAFTPFSNPSKVTSNLDLLVECKYRDDNVKWVFLPEINKPEFSNIVLGCTLRIVDEFSPYIFNHKYSSTFDMHLKYCYKGIEVRSNDDKASAYDSEIRHGVSQLQYGLPRLIVNNIWCNSGAYEDCVPFIFCPLIVTTAELIIIKEPVTIKDVRDCSNIDEIGDKVPYLLLYSDYGPEFEDHFSNEFKNLNQKLDVERIKDLEKLMKNSKHKIHEFNYPSKIIKSLINKDKYQSRHYFNQFIICNFNEFPKLVDQIKICVKKTLVSRKGL